MPSLSLSTPIASLLAAAGVTRSELADRLGVRRESVKDGDTIKLATLARAADVLGYELVVRLVAKAGAKAAAGKSTEPSSK